MHDNLIDRNTLLAHARLLLGKDVYSHEDSARVNGLLSMADRLGPDASSAETRDSSPEYRAFEEFARGRQRRDLGVGSPTQTAETSVLVQQGFYKSLTRALKAFDALFNEDVATVVETKTGAPMVLPGLDDTSASAVIQAEGALDIVDETAPITSAQLGTPSTFRSKIVLVSTELVQDSAFKIGEFLALSFAIRLARGIGPALVSALLGSAVVGATAKGSSKNTGGSENGTNSIGWSDLCALVGSVDPAYRSLERVFWVMNSATQLALNAIVCSNGHPLIHPVYDEDRRQILLGYPIAISPSMPDIGAGQKPIAFGATSYFITRIVENTTKLQVLMERYAEFGKVGYRAQMRANGTLLGVTNSGSPVNPTSPVQSLVNLAE